MENKNVLIIAGLAYIILYLLFYPPFYTSSDEQSYLRTAYLLQEGKLTVDDPFYSYTFIFNGEKYISKFPIGHSLILFPFTFFGWKAPFLTGLIIHLLGGVVFYRILKKIGFDTKYTLLYLFFPTLVWFSPTLFSEKSVMLFFLLAFYYYISDGKKHSFLSGLSFGLAFLVRNTSIIGFLSFAFVSFFRNRRQLLYMTLGFLPFLIAVMAYNNAFFGGPLITGYSVLPEHSKSGGAILFGDPLNTVYLTLASNRTVIPGVFSFTPHNLVYSSLNIIIALVILYPLMFFSPLLYRNKGRLEIILVTLGYVLFYSTSLRHYGGYEPVDVIEGMRHFIPVIPFLIITYISLYRKIVSTLHLPKGVYSIFILMLVIVSVLFFNLQYNLLGMQKQVSDDIYANTEDRALLIRSFTTSKYLVESLGDRRLIDSGVEDLSSYIDDKTYIIHKYHTGGTLPDNEIRVNRRMGNIIRTYPTTLVYSKDYKVTLPYASSRPFTLDIYKLGNDTRKIYD